MCYAINKDDIATDPQESVEGIWRSTLSSDIMPTIRSWYVCHVQDKKKYGMGLEYYIRGRLSDKGKDSSADTPGYCRSARAL